MNRLLTAIVGELNCKPMPSPALIKLEHGNKSTHGFTAGMDAYKTYFAKNTLDQRAKVEIKYKFLGAALDKVNSLNFGISAFCSSRTNSSEQKPSETTVLRNLGNNFLSPSYQKFLPKGVFDICSPRRYDRLIPGHSLIMKKMNKRAATAALLSFGLLLLGGSR